MIVGVVQKKTVNEIQELVAKLPKNMFDILELRLDHCTDWTLEKLQKIAFPLPILITLRPLGQGGAYPNDEENRQKDLLQLAQLKPTYIDVEYTVDSRVIQSIREVSPNTTIIVSRHDFEKTPENILFLFEDMQRRSGADICKLATKAMSTVDSLKMLVAAKQFSGRAIAICMGEDGSTTRILGAVVNTGFTYCPIEESSAPGQLSASLLRDVYHYDTLNHDTTIYGLLGDPVEQSIGHTFHNSNIRQNNHNSVYVKWRLKPEELKEAIPLLRELPVKGLSVTMPLKEAILPFVDSQEESVQVIGAANTVVVEKNYWKACNTDAQGALQSLNTAVDGKHVVVLGAGGAAKAIIYELRKQGATVSVLLRDIAKANGIDARAIPLSKIESLADLKYDIIVNTLPWNVPLTYSDNTFIQGSTVMDIAYGKKSTFLENAKKAKCICIDGEGMFYNQAKIQIKLWGLD